MKVSKICKQCNKKFISETWANRKFCSINCSSKGKVYNPLSGRNGFKRGYDKRRLKGQYKKGHKLNIGKDSPNWKGDKVSYVGIHCWIRRWKPKSMFCERCGKITEELDASSINHTYERDISKWKWLCKRCHGIERRKSK